MFAIGLPGVFSLAGWAPLIHTEFLVFRATQDRGSATLVDFAYGTITLCGTSFHYVSAIDSRSPFSPVLLPRARHRYRRGLGCCAFARHYLRNHYYFLLLWVLRCFSSPRSLDGLVPPCHGRAVAGFPIRTSAGQWVFAPHRGFSQLITSFIASESHRHPPCALFRFLCSFRLDH